MGKYWCFLCTLRPLLLCSEHYCAGNRDLLVPGKMSVILQHANKLLLSTWQYHASKEVHGFDGAAFREYADTPTGPVTLARGSHTTTASAASLTVQRLLASEVVACVCLYSHRYVARRVVVVVCLCSCACSCARGVVSLRLFTWRHV